MDRSKCEGCPLVEHMYMEEIALGDEVHYLVVTDAPSRSNALRQRLLSPSASDVLSRHLDDLGFDKKHFAFVPQVRCVFDPDTLPTKEKRQIAKQCRAHLLDTVELYKPSVVIPIGSDATNQTVGKSVKITKVRGLAEYNQELDAVVLPMLHPGFVARYPQHIATFAADCNSLARLVDNGLDTSISVLDSGVTYSFVEDLQFLVDMEPEILFFDTETTGLEFFKKGNASVRRYDPAIHGKEFAPNPAILTMQFCVRPGEAYMLVWDHPENPIPQRRKPKLVQQLIRLLSNPNTLVIGQNSTFDSRFMRACTGVKYEIGGDTLMLAALVDENAMSKGQDTLVKQYVPDMAGYADRFNSQYDKSRMWEVPLDELLMYGCGDVDTGFRLYDVLIRIVEKDELLTAQYQYVSMPGINTFVDVEMEGIYIDHDALSVFQRVMEETVEEEYRALLDQVPKSIQRKHIDKGLKFTRADFLLDILFRHPDGFRLRPQVFTKSTAKLPASLRVPSTSSKDHLPYFYESCPFTEQLASYIKNERLLSTNVKGFSNKYIHDGKVRPTYKLWVTVTGRSASEAPNGQNFPKRGPNAKAYRRSFVAPKGWVVIEADESQAELRIAADMANERTMISIYNSGGDIHISTALIVMGISMAQFLELPKAEQKAARQKAKAVNFGFIYGMGWRKFIGYAKTQYGVEFTEDEARRIREAFFSLYSGLAPWHDRMRAFATEHKFVRSYSGRVRHLPMIDSDDEMVRSEAGRQAINSPVQNFGSDLGIISMAAVRQDIDPAYLHPIAFVHDAIFCYAREEYAMWAAGIVKYYMETNPLEEMFGRVMKVPLIADVSVGRNFGDTYELAGFTDAESFDVASLWNEETQSGILLPPQKIPPMNGRRVTPLYSTCS